MKHFIFFLMLSLLLSSPVFARAGHDRPLRYTNQERNFKHAGAVRSSHHNTNMMNLNYKTGPGFNYKTGALCNYNTHTGFNYRPATNLRYR